MKGMEAPDVTFRRGPHGEIYPLPLTAGVEPREALERLVTDSAARGSPVDVPTRGKSLEGMLNLGLLYVHQLRLREALAGTLDLPEARALREAVVDEGVPMSLRPLMMEHMAYGFAPILRCLGDARWRVGEGEACVTFEEADPVQAVAKGQRVFKAWADADGERWEQDAEAAADRFPRSLFHDYWAHLARHDRVWDRGDGFSLRLVGRHNTFQLQTPTDRRILTTTAVRAAHLCDALARRSGSQPRYPPATEVMEWLSARGLPIPVVETERLWRVGRIEVQQVPEKHAIVLSAGDDYYAIQQEGGRQPELVLRQLTRGQGGGSRTLAHTAVEPPLRAWMKDLGRTVLSMWFVWKGGLEVE